MFLPRSRKAFGPSKGTKLNIFRIEHKQTIKRREKEKITEILKNNIDKNDEVM